MPKKPLFIAVILALGLSLPLCADGGTFTKKANRFSYGDWTLHREPEDDLAIWNKDLSMGFEIIRNSNGWWHIMWQGKEYIVWSTGDTDPQDFYSRPWEDKGETPLALKAGDWMSLNNDSYTTRLDVKKDSIVIVLDDEGTITIPKTGTDIGFIGYDGDEYSYPEGIDTEEKPYSYDDDDDDDYDYDDYDGLERSPASIGWIGRRVKIVDDGQVYSTINHAECLSWPDEETKKLAGEDSWRNFYPKDGDVGTVVWTTTHCDADTPIAIVAIRGNLVPIGISGLELSSGGGGNPTIYEPEQ